MKIGGLEKTTLVDFPGKVACTVFTIGCNFRCPFCYSSELVLPEKIKNHPDISEKIFFDFLKERQGLIEGVVICGGEPTIHEDLLEFIKKIKKLGFLVKLDTNGSNPKIIKKLVKESLVDYIAMDIKASKEKYNKKSFFNAKIQDIQESIDFIKQGKVDYEFRTTIVPTIHTKKEVVKMANWIGGSKKYFLQRFRPEKTINSDFEKIKSFADQEIQNMLKEIAKSFEICKLR